MRRKFQDRLARVRKVREIEERLARSEWAAAASAASDAEKERQRQEDGLAGARDDLRRSLETGSIDPRKMLLAQRAIDHQVERLIMADHDWLTLQSQANTLSEEWREREAKRRALSELAKRARERHRLEVQAADNAEMDEIASQRRARAQAPRTGVLSDFAPDMETGSS